MDHGRDVYELTRSDDLGSEKHELDLADSSDKVKVIKKHSNQLFPCPSLLG